MPTPFTKLITGEIPCAKLYEDDRFLSFLDIRPIRQGHALVIPKQEIDYIFDVPDELLRDLMVVAKPIAKAIEAHIPCQRVGVMVAGLEVPHCHVHLVPIDGVGDLNFGLASPADPAELMKLAEKIRGSL